MSRTEPANLESLRKQDLHDLADGLLAGAVDRAEGIQKCVEFVVADTKGHWHGRARAMMCRRLKHCELSPAQRQQLVTCITDRLASGNFSEQFRDQLRLALELDPELTFKIARQCLAGPKEYIRRLAAWVVKREGRVSE